MNSIIVKIRNGLGNQMFQYAIGRKLSVLNKCELKFDFFEFDFEKKNHEGIELNLYRFNIKGEFASINEIEQLKIKESKRIKNRLVRSLNNRLKKQISFYTFYKKSHIKDNWNNSLNVLKAHPPCYLEGDWSNIAYFDDIKNILQKELSLKDELKNNHFSDVLNEISHSKNSVAIHFRRKYALFPDANRIFGVLDLDYYYRALEYMKQMNGELELYVFADDVSWAKENFKPNAPMKIIERSKYLTDAHDWELMKCCKNQIISNSTYSWWAAYLNPNKKKRVIMPEVWYADPKFQKKYEKGHLIPQNWIKG